VKVNLRLNELIKRKIRFCLLLRERERECEKKRREIFRTKLICWFQYIVSKYCLVRVFIVYMYEPIIHTNVDVTRTTYSIFSYSFLSFISFSFSFFHQHFFLNDLCCSFISIIHLKIQVVYKKSKRTILTNTYST